MKRFSFPSAEASWNAWPGHDSYAGPAFDRLAIGAGGLADVEKYTTWIMGELLAGRVTSERAQVAVRWARAQAGAPDEEWAAQAALGVVL